MPCYNWCNTKDIKAKTLRRTRSNSLSKKCWRSKLIFFCKIFHEFLPKYLYSYLIFSSQENYPLRSALTIKINSIPSRTKSFKDPYCINEWNKNLNAEVRNAK